MESPLKKALPKSYLKLLWLRSDEAIMPSPRMESDF
jgi:hypothetical protein